jgi:hypothetical protein
MKRLLTQLTGSLSLFLVFVSISDVSAFYNPQVQRWLNRDPIGEEGGMNLYAFVRNNPIKRFDAQGLFVSFPDPTSPDFPLDPPDFPDFPPSDPKKPSSPNQCAAGNCPNFESQWDKLGEVGKKLPPFPIPGKITCTGARTECHRNCAAKYGSGADEEDDIPACLKMCKLDCELNYKRCIGAKTPTGPKK